MSDTAYDRLRAYVADQRSGTMTTQGANLINDIEVLLREVDAMKTFGGGGYQHAHRRMTNAINGREAARRENQILTEQIETMGERQDLPLWRRITNQRREIRALWALAEMYRRTWRREVEMKIIKEQRG